MGHHQRTVRPQVGPTPGITRPRLAPGGVITSALGRGYQSAEPHESVDPCSEDIPHVEVSTTQHETTSAFGAEAEAIAQRQTATRDALRMDTFGSSSARLTRCFTTPPRASRRRERPGVGLTPGITESGLSPGGMREEFKYKLFTP